MNKPLPIPLQLDPDPNQAVDTFVRAVIASGLSALDTGRASAPTKLRFVRRAAARDQLSEDGNVRAPRSPLC